MAADNRIRELALSIERRAGIAPDADGLRQIREWATEIVCQCDMVERVQEQAEPAWKSRAAGCVPAGQQGVKIKIERRRSFLGRCHRLLKRK